MDSLNPQRGFAASYIGEQFWVHQVNHDENKTKNK